LSDCLKTCLEAVIKANYENGSYASWPVLTSSDYAKNVTAYLEEENINFGQKFDNPANVPEARSIEDFWSYPKKKVYKKNWGAQNLDQLATRIKYFLHKNGNTVVQSLANSTIRRIDSIRRNGVI